MSKAEMTLVGHFQNHNGASEHEYRTILRDELTNLQKMPKSIEDVKNDVLDVMSFRLGTLQDKIEKIENQNKSISSFMELILTDSKVTFEDHKDYYKRIDLRFDEVLEYAETIHESVLNSEQSLESSFKDLVRRNDDVTRSVKSIAKHVKILSVLNFIMLAVLIWKFLKL